MISQIWSKKSSAVTVGGPQARTLEIVSTVPDLGPRVLGAKTGSTPTMDTFNIACLLESGHVVSIVARSHEERYEILDDVLARLAPTLSSAPPGLPGQHTWVAPRPDATHVDQ